MVLGKTDMVLGKKVAIFYWEWGRNSAPREGQKMSWELSDPGLHCLLRPICLNILGKHGTSLI